MHVYMYSLLLSIVFHDREKLGRRWTYGCHGRTVSEGSSGREPSRGVRYTAAGNRSQERGGSEGGVHRFGGIWFCELDVLSDRLTFDIWCWGSLRQQLANQMASNGATWPYLTSIIFEFEFRKIVLVCAEMTHPCRDHNTMDAAFDSSRAFFNLLCRLPSAGLFLQCRGCSYGGDRRHRQSVSKTTPTY